MSHTKIKYKNGKTLIVNDYHVESIAINPEYKSIRINFVSGKSVDLGVNSDVYIDISQETYNELTDWIGEE